MCSSSLASVSECPWRVLDSATGMGQSWTYKGSSESYASYSIMLTHNFRGRADFHRYGMQALGENAELMVVIVLKSKVL